MKINWTPHFQRSFKRYRKKHYPVNLIFDCVEAIINQNTDFLRKHHDHSLSRDRELHIDPKKNNDWLLIYRFDRVSRQLVLVIIDIGNHDELHRMDI